MLYLDSSALTKLILDEPESHAVRAAIKGKPLATSEIALTEVPRAVARTEPRLARVAERVFEGLSMAPLDRDLLRAAAILQPAALRSLDALHIVSALALGAELEAFVTYDRRQQVAALTVGLRVESPT